MLRKITVDCTLYIMVATAILLLPLNWLFAAFCAAAVHEFSHFLALRLCGAQVESVRIGSSGAVIVTEPLTAGKEALCAMAGPLGGVLLLTLAPIFPAMSVCALVQSAFNLLPIYPLDGGRILKSVASMIFLPQTANRICTIIQVSAKLLLLVMCVYFAFKLHLGVVAILMLFMLVGKIDLAN